MHSDCKLRERNTHTYLQLQCFEVNCHQRPTHTAATQHTNNDCLVKQHSDSNVHITFIMLILIRKIIKIKKYARNKSTTALLEGIFLKLLKVYLMHKFRSHDPLGSLVACVKVNSSRTTRHSPQSTTTPSTSQQCN